MTSKAAGKNPLLAKPKRYFSSAIIVVVAVGLAGSAMAGVNAMLLSRDLMLSRALTAASALSSSEVTGLEGTDKDLDKPSYNNLKERMTRIQQDNPGTRFAYLLGQRPNGQVFFYVDSEPPASTGYSPPGEPYQEASTKLKAAFSSDTPFIEGPLRDSYGTWISALAPVIDESTGQVVTVLGIDVSAYDYYRQIATYAVIPILLAAIPLSVLLRSRRLEAKELEIMGLKSQFVSVASHELRSPLAGTLWGVQSLIKPDTNKNLTIAQRGLLAQVYNSTASSLATVNEILDFSIFDRNKADKLQRESVNLKDILTDIQKVLALSAREAKVAIRFTGEWPASVTTIGDPGALKRAFNNLISNAIKYSPKDSAIELHYSTNDIMHVISVRDHGIGIPEDEQAKVLQGYYRATNATKAQAHGTGLGLWIAKLIVEQHGGKLWLESKEKQGTSIFVSLPSQSKKEE